MRYLNQLTVILFLLGNTLFAQVSSNTGYWSGIGDVNLSIVTTDADNGDGVGDGAVFSDGLSMATGQGAAHTFGGSMTLGESITINTYTYNDNVSYVRFNVDLYNLTDNVVLVTTPSSILISNNTSPPVLTTLNYTATANDVGDVLQVRYIRDDPGHTYRNLVIDNLYLGAVDPANNVPLNFSQICPFTLTPDLSLIPSNPSIEAEINLIVDRFSDNYLGTSAPSAGALSSAESSYNSLNISVNSGEITGNPISSFSTAAFLKTFAQHLKFNPGDAVIQEKANNTVWWVSKQFCSGALPRDLQKYSYEDFARPASLLKDFLDPDVKDLFAYTLYVHSGDFEHYWEPVYDQAYQTAHGSIDTDLIYNIIDAMMAYVTWQDTDQERYRYMRGFQRYLERFFSYTTGTTDGIKKDGAGFHHWTAYTNYMYAYKTAASLLSYLSETSFQVNPESYKVFRNAVYYQFMLANDDGVQGMGTSGRKPDVRLNQFNQSSLKTLAIEGGKILGLTTADPILAGMYNRIYGVDGSFNYSTIAPFTEGFFQFNHTHAAAFRKNDWVAFAKGFSNNMWGAELYNNTNRYGRYQSYGTLEVIYPGNKISGNGYGLETWDWNFNPGTTVIKLPWDQLHGEWSRIDELQQKRFVGALALDTKNSEVLTNNHGSFGMFAMDFQEAEGNGFGTNYSSNNHNSTFTFKKSTFFFDDLIVNLGSGITNNDNINSTITTFYQRLDNSGNSVFVNGTSQSSLGEVTFSGATNNWVLSNFNTGFYLLSGSHSLKVKKESQQTPNHNQTWPVNYSGNPTATYYTGYIDHGTNPSNNSYEYIVKPGSSVSEMQSLHTAIQGGNKPYIVHQKNSNAHIVEHIASQTWGYAFFNSAANLTYDFVTDVSGPCLAMTKYDSTNQTLLVSLSNPDLGFESRSYTPSITVIKQLTLQGEWHFATTNPDVVISSSNASETVLDFTTVDGLSYEVLLVPGPENCASSTTFTSGSWSNGNPNNTKKAVFTEDYDTTISGSIEACTCEIKAGVSVTIKANDYMNINGNIAVNGTLTVEHEGSVVQIDDDAIVVNNGTINVDLTTPTLASRDFMVMGSPMTNSTRQGVWNSAFLVLNHVTANFVPNAAVEAALPGAENFADDNYDNWVEYPSGAINAGEGYIVRPQSGYGQPGGVFNYTYNQGTLNNGVVNFPIVYNTGGTPAENRNASPNVLANPYASAIFADDFINANAMIDEVYFWEHLTPPSPSIPGAGSMNFDMQDISMYNLMGGTEAANDPGTTTQPNGYISTGQGFGIKAKAGGTAVFNNSMRRTTGNNTLRTPESYDRDRIWVKVSQEEYELQSQTLIGFSGKTTAGMDPGYDSRRLATILSIYSHLEDGSEQLGIQSRETFNSGKRIPLGFSTLLTDKLEYTLSIAQIEGPQLSGARVYLIDHQENIMVNLSEVEQYHFSSEEGTYHQRFSLFFRRGHRLLETESNDLEEGIGIYPNPTADWVNIASPILEIEGIRILDLQGRVVAASNEQGKLVQMNLSHLQSTVYFVEITTEMGNVTKRLVKK